MYIRIIMAELGLAEQGILTSTTENSVYFEILEAMKKVILIKGLRLIGCLDLEMVSIPHQRHLVHQDGLCILLMLLVGIKVLYDIRTE